MHTSRATIEITATRPQSWLKAARLVYPRNTHAFWGKRFRFLLRASFNRRAHSAWLNSLGTHDLRELWQTHPRLAEKLQRPYLVCTYGSQEKLAALQAHYELWPARMSAFARSAVFRGGLELLRLTHATSGRHLRLKMCYLDQFEKEGELTLILEDTATSLTLAGITFALVRRSGAACLMIGGVQASPDPRTRGLIHDVAKEMHGFRPKALILWCLQELALAWRLEAIYAISDDQHIYRHWRKRRAFAASYNEFWAESDGQRLADGGWLLPIQLRERSRQELKPSRRKAHERRYAMLAALRQHYVARLDLLRRSSDVAILKAPGFVYSERFDTAPAPESPIANSSRELAGQIPNHSY